MNAFSVVIDKEHILKFNVFPINLFMTVINQGQINRWKILAFLEKYLEIMLLIWSAYQIYGSCKWAYVYMKTILWLNEVDRDVVFKLLETLHTIEIIFSHVLKISKLDATEFGVEKVNFWQPEKQEGGRKYMMHLLKVDVLLHLFSSWESIFHLEMHACE